MLARKGSSMLARKGATASFKGSAPGPSPTVPVGPSGFVPRSRPAKTSMRTLAERGRPQLRGLSHSLCSAEGVLSTTCSEGDRSRGVAGVWRLG